MRNIKEIVLSHTKRRNLHNNLLLAKNIWIICERCATLAIKAFPLDYKTITEYLKG